jgi:hypothetical protein
VDSQVAGEIVLVGGRADQGVVGVVDLLREQVADGVIGRGGVIALAVGGQGPVAVEVVGVGGRVGQGAVGVINLLAQDVAAAVVGGRGVVAGGPFTPGRSS